MRRKSVISGNWPRYVLEWGVLAALVLLIGGIIKTENVDPETYCPMGGLQAFTTYLVRGSLPCSMSSVQIMMGLVMAMGVMLFSKLFCAYICPVGTVQDLVRKLRNFLRLKSIPVKDSSFLDKFLRITKYALLFWIFYSTATASELWCKNLDPYYAVATGFKGEITMWMSITTVCMVLVGGLFVDNFFCRYICPLGAACNTFKFWLWCAALAGFWFLLNSLEMYLPWWVFLAIFCVMGYILEVAYARPKLQLLYVYKDPMRCNGCGQCLHACPQHINLTQYRGRISHVDCTLCGDCTAACSRSALHTGVMPWSHRTGFSVILPAVLSVGLCIGAYFMGQKYELPTIDETWGIYSADSLHTRLIDPSTLEQCTLEGLKQVHCYGSSMAFKGKLEKIAGVHGVKTYVKSHKATITYNPAKTSPEKISEEIYVPSHFKCFTPDFRETPRVKVLTIRTENMPAASDVNFLGIQFKQVDSLVYGLESQWDCPLVVRMFVDTAFCRDAAWIKSIVEKPSLDLPRADGTIKSTPTAFKFVRMEKGEEIIPTTEFLQRMFTNPFLWESAKRQDKAAEALLPQYIYEFADENFTKPVITRNLPFVSNTLSAHEGVLAVYTCLNEDYVPCLRVRYCEPMTSKEIYSILTQPEWTITYAVDDIRQVPAKLQFKREGVVKTFPTDYEPKTAAKTPAKKKKLKK